MALPSFHLSARTRPHLTRAISQTVLSHSLTHLQLVSNSLTRLPSPPFCVGSYKQIADAEQESHTHKNHNFTHIGFARARLYGTLRANSRSWGFSSSTSNMANETTTTLPPMSDSLKVNGDVTSPPPSQPNGITSKSPILRNLTEAVQRGIPRPQMPQMPNIQLPGSNIEVQWVVKIQ